MTDENKHPFTDAEAKLVERGALKIVSTWYDDPYITGVLADGRTVIMSVPTHLPAKPPEKP